MGSKATFFPTGTDAGLDGTDAGLDGSSGLVVIGGPDGVTFVTAIVPFISFILTFIAGAIGMLSGSLLLVIDVNSSSCLAMLVGATVPPWIDMIVGSHAVDVGSHGMVVVTVSGLGKMNRPGAA